MKYRIVKLANGKFAVQTKDWSSLGFWCTDRGYERGDFGYFDSVECAKEAVQQHIDYNSDSVDRIVKEI